jgi:5'-methylthioadenosine nucleosidase
MDSSQPLIILCAMQGEADAIITALELKQSSTPWARNLPPRMWSGQTHGRVVHLVTNGHDPRTGVDLIGTTPATLATQLIATHLDPCGLLVAGAAGGCSKTTSIGQVLMIERAYHHDRRIPLPEFEAYAHGPEKLIADSVLAEKLGVQLGVISTGNALDTPEIDLAFFKAHNINVKDMETASIAWTANLSSIPVMALRSITDHYDHPAPETQFLSNFALSLKSLATTISNGIECIMNLFATDVDCDTVSR